MKLHCINIQSSPASFRDNLVLCNRKLSYLPTENGNNGNLQLRSSDNYLEPEL